MVHRIFKSIVPHTNKHNLELTLLRQVNTLQTLRYLADGGMDDRINNMTPQSIFKELIIEPRLRHLLSGWCINDSSFSIHILDNEEDDKSNTGNTKSFIINGTYNSCAMKIINFRKKNFIYVMIFSFVLTKF